MKIEIKIKDEKGNLVAYHNDLRSIQGTLNFLHDRKEKFKIPYYNPLEEYTSLMIGKTKIGLQ